MSVTFTKLFASITESTVWSESHTTRIVWITMLAMADKHGRVWASIPGLAHRARVPVKDVRIAIAKFLSPDPDSRTPDNDGKRIEPIDGGWRLLNYMKYRGVRDEEEQAERKAQNQAAYRARKSDRSLPDVTGCDLNADAEAEAEAEAVKKEQKQKQASPSAPSRVKKPSQNVPEQKAVQGTNEYSPSGSEENGMEYFDSVNPASETQIPCGNDKPKGHRQPNGNGRSTKDEAQQVYAVYPKKVGGRDALRSIGKAIDRLRGNGTADPVAYLIARIEAWLAKRARDAAVGEFVPSYPNPATWFNQERYNDPENAPKPKMEIYVLSPEEASALWERDFGKYVQVHSRAE